jgi:hypothetical protein
VCDVTIGTHNRRTDEVARLGASNFVLMPKYYYADQIKENEVHRTCGMHGKERKVYRKIPKVIDHSEDRGVDGRMGSE